MRPLFTLSLSLLSLAVLGCDLAVTEASAEDSLTAAAISGGEEEISPDGLGRGNGEALDPMRSCDATGEHDGLWARADGDGSGKLEQTEQEDTVREHGRAPRHFRLLRWIYDTDDSGDLSEAEREVLLADHTLRCEAMQARLLAEFDADGDGQLSEDERDAAREAREAMHGTRPEGAGRPGGQGGPPAGLDEGAAPPPIVEEFDADGDGSLSADEKATARATLRERIQNGERPIAPPSEG